MKLCITDTFPEFRSHDEYHLRKWARITRNEPKQGDCELKLNQTNIRCWSSGFGPLQRCQKLTTSLSVFFFVIKANLKQRHGERTGPSSGTREREKKASLIDEIYFAIILFHASSLFPILFNPFRDRVKKCSGDDIALFWCFLFVPKRSFSKHFHNDITFYSSLRNIHKTHTSLTQSSQARTLCVHSLQINYAK